MERNTGRVLKENQVKMQGQLKLHMKDPESVPPGDNNTNHKAKCRIVEKNPNHTVIEVVCACGAKMYLQCHYTDTKTQNSDSKNQTNTRPVTANNNREK